MRLLSLSLLRLSSASDPTPVQDDLLDRVVSTATSLLDSLDRHKLLLKLSGYEVNGEHIVKANHLAYMDTTLIHPNPTLDHLQSFLSAVWEVKHLHFNTERMTKEEWKEFKQVLLGAVTFADELSFLQDKPEFEDVYLGMLSVARKEGGFYSRLAYFTERIAFKIAERPDPSVALVKAARLAAVDLNLHIAEVIGKLDVLRAGNDGKLSLQYMQQTLGCTENLRSEDCDRLGTALHHLWAARDVNVLRFELDCSRSNTLLDLLAFYGKLKPLMTRFVSIPSRGGIGLFILKEMFEELMPYFEAVLVTLALPVHAVNVNLSPPSVVLVQKIPKSPDSVANLRDVESRARKLG
jgi:hypothetical protein